MKRIKSRFTLIEMLAVAAIASILIALITPAVQAMLFGSRVDHYTSNFKLGMERAQSKAVAARKYVAMVLPSKHVDAPEEVKPYCKGGYRLAYVKKDGSSYKFDSWVEDWKNPNDGAMLLKVINDTDKADDAPTAPGKDEAIFGLLNKVDGTLNGVGSACENEHQALIFSPYGGLVNHDQALYFTFSEAKFNGEDYELPNSDNFLVLKLNPVTGRISYFDPYAEAAAE